MCCVIASFIFFLLIINYMVVQRIFFLIIFIFLILIFPTNSLACLSITDDLNSPNPVLNANFSIQPDVSPLTDCWSGAIRIRSSENGWRLVANRTGPSPTTSNSNPSDNVTANDIRVTFTLDGFGMASPNDAVLVSPFSSETNLSSIQSGTFIISGIKRTSNSCSSFNSNYYKLTKRLCLFRDFVFNTGEYNGQISYILIRP